MGFTAGAVVDVDGPHGQFVYSASDRPTVLIPGGIGITPFRSMLGELAATRPSNLTLLYSNATAGHPVSNVFREPQRRLAAAARGVYRHPSERRVAQTSPDASTPDSSSSTWSMRLRPRTRVCGPSALVEAMQRVLVESGVETNRIKAEGFPGYEAAVAA